MATVYIISGKAGRIEDRIGVGSTGVVLRDGRNNAVSLESTLSSHSKLHQAPREKPVVLRDHLLAAFGAVSKPCHA